MNMMDPYLKKLLNEMNHAQYLFDNCTDYIDSGMMDSIIFRLKSLEIERDNYIKSKKIEKEPLKTPNIKKIITDRLYQLNLFK